MKYAAILRGINVSGKNKVNMKELKSFLEKAGFKEVETYIQSGNIVFSEGPFASNNTGEASTQIQQIIKSELNLDVPVIALTKVYLEQVVEANPYRKEDLNFQAITFLQSPPLSSDLPDLDYKNDVFTYGENCVYLFCPGGFGRTKLTNNFIELKTKVVATTRNMKTCLKLLDLLN